MFSYQNSELIIGGVTWVFNLNPLVTSVHDIIHPKPYIYNGRFTTQGKMEDVLKFKSNDEDIEISVESDYTTHNTGFYILGQNRTRIITVLRNLAKRPAMDSSFNYIAKAYISHLTKEKPEWIL